MLNTQSRPVWVEIQPNNIAHNLRRVRELCPDAQLMAVIKADGYGHGMLMAAKALNDADAFGVNSIDDVKRLRAAGFDKPCNLFAPHLTLDTLIFCAQNQCRPTVYDHTHFELLESLPTTARLDIWLKVDTGMGRLGFDPQGIPAALERLSSCTGVAKVHLMSHLASADDAEDDLNEMQFERFAQFDGLPVIQERSLLNSAGIVGFPHHAYDWVRPGIMLYGISPSKQFTSATLGLKSAMNFNSRIISIKKIKAGQGVGYASTFVAPQDMRIAVVAAGYGDGYPRHAPNGTPVWLNGQTVGLLGRVSMDMLVIDLRSLDQARVNTTVGDTVQLWGDKNPAESVAAQCGTIAYELTCGILPRVERQLC
jgi:alanine racemase